MTGIPWCFTILVLTILGTKGGREGRYPTPELDEADSSSTHMIPKQREMDSIVKQIFTAMESESHLQSTLFVVCGDHGMNDAGNHGASSPGETSPALVFLSPKLRALQSTFQAPVSEAEDF